MTHVALTRASTISPILACLQSIGVSIDRLLATAELPPWITHRRHAESLIPARSTLRLLGPACRETGLPSLGLNAAERNGVRSLGMLGRLIGAAPTLGAALESVVRYSRTMTSNRPLWLCPRGDRVDFCMAVEDDLDPRDVGWQQDDQFSLGLMISAVRMAAGPCWRPTEVHLQTGEAAGLRDAETLADARIAFRQPVTMVAIPRELLAAPLSPAPNAAPAENAFEDWKSSAPVRDFAGSVRQAIETLSCGDDYPAVGETAAFVGMSVRTLQRHLAAAGVSHDTLVAQTRFAMAAAVLEDTDAKILDLALDLGYSDHANFTRAFRRWAGCSPRAYRLAKQEPRRPPRCARIVTAHAVSNGRR
jgi:AraC-like DNA-binding protein